jgi:predicted transcriptional regulator with HTH domain
MRIRMKTVNYLLVIFMLGVFFSACTSSKSDPTDESNVRGVVEGLGQRPKLVSVLSPSAAEDMKAQ